MLRIFISYASPDASIAQRLYDDLKNTGHEVVVDLHSARMGDDLIEFMNSSIADADVILVLYSKATRSAKWQREELHAAVWQETDQEGARVIVLKIDDEPLPPLLAKRLCGSLKGNNYHATFAKLCSELLSGNTATSLLSKALAVGSPNPFWRVRAEYFDEEWPRLLAEAFSPPGAAKIGTLEEMKPCFLEGSRGTGKTMLLLSLRARILASRRNTSKSIKELFGFYVRLDRGAFCNAGIKDVREEDFGLLDRRTLNQLAETFAQELYLLVIESLLSELAFCFRNDVLRVSAAEQGELARGIFSKLYGTIQDYPRTIDELSDHCAEMHRKLSEFVRRRFIYEEPVAAPIATLDIEVLRRIIAVVRRTIPQLSESQFTLLLDEYENLFPYQQVVVNSIVKLGPPAFSIKIARKVGTNQTSQTTIGQDLQEIHDYNQIVLVYSVESDSECRRYIDLLESIVSNLFRSQGLKPIPLEKMLPIDDSLEVDHEKLQSEILALLKMTPQEFTALSPQEQASKLTYYREAAVYRIVYGKRGVRGEKRFCGVKQLAFLSSGVIRWFQEILGMAYHLEYRLDGAGSDIIISPKSQTRAVYIVSNHNLAALGRNIEEYGERLKYFLLDLGDCLRQKLLKHGSEPEAGRIAIMNPELLETDKFSDLAALLRVGVREGVFQTLEGRPGMRPKHGEPQPVEFNISRIYAPALQFSPRLRWKTSVACSELRGLLDPDARRTTKSKLMKKVAAGRRSPNQAEMPYLEASDESTA